MNFFTYLLSGFTGLVQSLVSDATPMGRSLMYGNNYSLPNGIPDFGFLVELAHRREINYGEYLHYSKFYGYDNDWAEKIFQNSYQYLSLFDYIRLFRRGEMDRDMLQSYADRLKISTLDVDNAIKTTEFFPSPGDLVRFAVREVYNPDIAQRFGLFEDLPKQFISEGRKAGLPEDQAKNFWAAHWILPSAGQGFEMFQRRIIDQDTLKMLLRTQDVMPFWRDKMISLAYSPLTRVDVRRMYGLGVLNEAGVHNSYLDFGYSPENAKLMTEFTMRYENQEADGLTRSNIIKAYKESLINREELINYLTLLNYTDKVIEFWVELADFEKTEEQISLIKEDAIEGYRKGDLSIDDIRDRLLKEDLPAEFVNRLIKDVLLQDAKRRKVPSQGDLTDWLNARIIDEEYYVSRMRLLGYRDIDIQSYLTEIAFKQDTTKRKYLSIKKYQTWLSTEIMSVPQFSKIAKDMHYSRADIDRLIGEAM